jgi:outer membrane protein
MRLTFFTKFFFLVLLAGPVVVVAQPAPGQPWSLQACIDYALKNNLQVRQSGFVTERSRIDHNQSRENLLPTISGNANQTNNFGTSTDPFTNVFVRERIQSANFSLFTNLNVFSGFQLQNNLKRLALEYEASLSDLERDKNTLILNVVTQYTQILFADELLQTSQLQLANTHQQAERTQKLFRAGAVPESNVLELNAQIATDELTAINAQNQKDIARLQLMQLLNLNMTQPFEVEKPQVPDPSEEIIAFNANEVFVIAQQAMPEVRSADLRVRSAIKGIEASRGGYYPSVFLGAGVFTGYSNQVNRFSPIDYTFQDQLRDNLGQQLRISLQVPILNGLQVRNNVALSKIALDNARVNSDLVRLQLRQVIEQSYTDALAAQKRYIATNRQLMALELSYRNAETRFNSGVMNVTDFNVALNNFRRAQSDLIQARYDYVFRLKILDFYQGNPLTF